MKLDPCVFRFPLPEDEGGRVFCAHPQVRAANGLVPPGVCKACCMRAVESELERRRLPRLLQSPDEVVGCYYRGPQSSADMNHFDCFHPAHNYASSDRCRYCQDYQQPLKKQESRRWAVGITTAPRREDVLPRTINSLEAAGWSHSEMHLFAEPDSAADVSDFRGSVTRRGRRVGAFSNWYLALHELLFTHPSAEVFLMCQDDIVCCAGLRAYLEQMLWPSPNTAFVSLYCGCLQPRAENSQGFVRIGEGDTLYGALAVAFPAAAIKHLILDPLFVRHRNSTTGMYGIDAALARWVSVSRLPAFFHFPSLVAHTGHTSAILAAPRDGPERQTDSFVGEEVDARDVCTFN